MLCLLEDDYQLANIVFSRAQATDPEYAQAWLGQGLLARVMGELEEAPLLVTHAFEISDSSLPLARSQYALSAFDQFIKKAEKKKKDSTTLIQPLFALHQVRSQSRPEPAVEHVSTLFSERAGDYSAAVRSLTELCDAAEQDYEISESVSSLTRFAHGKADLARNLLATGDYEAAAENAETSLQLSVEDTDGEPSIGDTVLRQKCRLSAHLTAGLAYHQSGATEEAMSKFRSAYSEFEEGSADIVCLIAQVLWTHGRKDERAMAMEQLLNVNGREPNHLPSMLLLAVIALLESDHDALDAVLSDLESLRMSTDLDSDQRRQIQDMLISVTAVSPPSSEDNKSKRMARVAMDESKVSVVQFPFQPVGWTQLASLCDDLYPAKMALKTAQHAVPPRGSVSPETLAQSFAATGQAAHAQSAIMVAPWLTVGWVSLGELLCGE